LYIADSGNRRVRALDPSGTITTVADFGGAGGDRQATDLTGVALHVDGRLLVIDRLHHRILGRDREGALSIIAGRGTAGNAGDGGPAVQAELAYPSAIAIGPDGTLLVSDAGNGAVRAVGVDGVIRTVATSRRGSELAPAVTESALSWEPSGVAADSAGNVYFTDRRNHSVRRIDAEGKIALIAGEETVAGRAHAVRVTAESLALRPLSQPAPPVDLAWEYVLESGSDDNSIHAIAAGEPDVAYLAGDVGSGADWRIQQLLAGQPGWRFDLSGSEVDIPLALTRTPDGTLVATGMEDDEDGDRDAMVVAIGSDGRERWRHNEARPGEQTCRGIAADQRGTVYLACESEGRWEIASFDSTGKRRWQHDDGTRGSARAIAADSDGGIFVAGEQPQGWRVVKLGDDGTPVWQHQIPGRSAAHGIAATGDGGAIAVGSRTSGRLNLRAERLRADGTVAWEYEAGSTAGAVVAHAVTLDRAGLPLLAGEIGSDWLVLALDDAGKRRWHFTHDGGGGLSNRDQAFAIAFAPPDGILVAGRVHRLPRIPPSLGQVEWRAASYRRREVER
jgi:DNA-binding beta-propeller fold protein YncE